MYVRIARFSIAADNGPQALGEEGFLFLPSHRLIRDESQTPHYRLARVGRGGGGARKDINHYQEMTGADGLPGEPRTWTAISRGGDGGGVAHFQGRVLL